LEKLRRGLLTRLGRQHEALEAAWTEYKQHPSKSSYDDLMKFVPEIESREWHDRALDAARAADLHSQLELFIEIGETERLVALVRSSTDQALEP